MSEWISVKDRLPNEREEVDVWMDVPASALSMGWSDSFRVPDAYISKGEWVHRQDYKEKKLNVHYITHWRPLPLAPKDAA